MTHYKIITDLPRLEEFIEWLPELNDSEAFYLELFCRRKYDQKMPSSKTYNLMRHVAKKSNLLSMIQRFEVPLGSYYLKGEKVSQESLAMYITINPRCLKKATFGLMKSLVDQISNDNKYSPYSLSMTEIHRAKSKSRFVMFDLDDYSHLDAEATFRIASKIVNRESLSLLRTHGGYHLLVKIDAVTATGNWYSSIASEMKADQSGDIMTPIPGCIQGGMTPKMEYYNGSYATIS